MSTRRAIDMGRLAAAVARPGIDPRVWLTYALVDEVGFDAQNGLFASVTYIPSGEEQCALVGAAYAGDGFGLYAPLIQDDMVLVAVPAGDSNEGPVVIARLWNAADKPAPDFGSGTVPTPDFWLRVADGKNLKIHASGAGKIELVGEGSGDVSIKQSGTGNIFIHAVGGANKVYLGVPDASSGSEPVTLGQTLQTFLSSVKTWLDTHIHTTTATVSAGPVAVVGPPTASSPTPPNVRATKAEVK